MPRLNRLGQAVMGVGNGPLSVDGHVLRGDGGGPSVWFDDNTVLHSVNAETDLLQTNIHTGQSARVGPGVNECAANGAGRYIGWRAGTGVIGALTVPSGGLARTITDARGAAAEDGTLAYVRNRSDDNSPTVLNAPPTGQEMELPGGIYGLSILRFGQAIWNGGSHGLPPMYLLPQSSWHHVAEISGELWLCYWTPKAGLVAHRAQEKGSVYLIEADENRCFHWHAREVGGKFAVAYSTTTGEGPGHLVKHLDVTALPSKPWDEMANQVPPPPEPIPVDQVPPLVGKRSMIWYEQKGNVPHELLPPGNAFHATRGQSGPQERKAVVTGKWDDPAATVNAIPKEHTIGYRVGSEELDVNDPITTMEERAWEAHHKGYRPFFYWDSRRPPRWPSNLPPGTVYEQNCYCGANESPAAAEAEFDSIVRDELLPRYDHILLCAQTHTTNNALLREPSQMIPGVVNIANRYQQQVIGLAVFNNSGRDDNDPNSPTYGEGGLTANPQLRPHWEKVFSGVTGQHPIFGDSGGGGSVNVRIDYHDPRVSRSNPHGCNLKWDVDSERPIVKYEIGAVDQNGNFVSVTHKPKWDPEPGDDGRYCRQFGVKFVIDGIFRIRIRAWDDQGNIGDTTSTTTVEVYSESTEVPPRPTTEGCVNGRLENPEAWVWAYLSWLAKKPIRPGDHSGGPDEWKALLKKTKFTVNPPQGAPVPCSAPCYGIAMGMSGGEPTSRIWLRTRFAYDVGDGNQWFLRRVDLIHHETQTYQWGEWPGDPTYDPCPCPNDNF